MIFVNQRNIKKIFVKFECRFPRANPSVYWPIVIAFCAFCVVFAAFNKGVARHFVESHFVGTTFGRIRLLVDVTFRRVRHSVEKVSRYDISSK